MFFPLKFRLRRLFVLYVMCKIFLSQEFLQPRLSQTKWIGKKPELSMIFSSGLLWFLVFRYTFLSRDFYLFIMKSVLIKFLMVKERKCS